jgi:hypothetical protein
MATPHKHTRSGALCTYTTFPTYSGCSLVDPSEGFTSKPKPQPTPADCWEWVPLVVALVFSVVILWLRSLAEDNSTNPEDSPDFIVGW